MAHFGFIRITLILIILILFILIAIAICSLEYFSRISVIA